MKRETHKTLEPIAAEYLRTLRDHAYTKIRDFILSGHFAPDRRLRERQLARELGISTTPIKEALRRLELEGLIISVPRRGTFVCYARETAAEMALIRAALESVVARLAALKIGPQEIALLKGELTAMRLATRARDYEAVVDLNARFHDLIHAIADNAYLRKQLENLAVYDEINRRQALKTPGEIDAALAEHSGIVAALSAHDPELAESRMRQHIIRSSESRVEAITRKEAS